MPTTNTRQLIYARTGPLRRPGSITRPLVITPPRELLSVIACNQTTRFDMCKHLGTAVEALRFSNPIIQKYLIYMVNF